VIEQWKQIGTSAYEISNLGRCRHILKNGYRMLKPYWHKKKRRDIYVYKIKIDGKQKELKVISLVAEYFLGHAPDGYVPVHINGMQTDNFVNNITYKSLKQIGIEYGPKSTRKPVAKLNSSGEIIEIYTSARSAARDNYCSYQTVIDRCNGKVKKPFGDVDFAWDDSECSVRWAIRRLEREFGSQFANAPDVDFEW